MIASVTYLSSGLETAPSNPKKTKQRSTLHPCESTADPMQQQRTSTCTLASRSRYRLKHLHPKPICEIASLVARWSMEFEDCEYQANQQLLQLQSGKRRRSAATSCCLTNIGAHNDEKDNLTSQIENLPASNDNSEFLVEGCAKLHFVISNPCEAMRW